MKRSRQAAIRLVLTAWRDRGWQERDDAALAVVEAMVDLGEYDDRLVEAVPDAFLDRNGITRNEVKEEICRILSTIKIDDANLAVAPRRLKIVFFAANPADQQHLELEEEAREVERRLRATDHRDVIDFVTKWAVRASDLIEALNQERPQAIHFSGHGSRAGELVFQNDLGGTHVVSDKAIAALIRTVAGEVRLVLFNNCFSIVHAQEAAKHVEAAIGMNASISDDAARAFAANFYAALGYGRSVGQAFEQARVALMLAGLPEEQIPQLFSRADIDPAKLVLVSASTGGPAERPTGTQK